MRPKRETTYGMPTRILTNASRGRITQAAHDHDATHREPRWHNVAERIEYTACRAGRPRATDPGAQAAGVAPHPRPRWPRPPAECAKRVHPQVADHAER